LAACIYYININELLTACIYYININELLTACIYYIPINIIEKQLFVLSFRSLYVLYYWSCTVSHSLCTVVVISNHSSI